MAVLVDADRVGVRKRFAGELSAARLSFGLSKLDLQAAINGIDDWVEANQAAFNTAIPQPARSGLTAKQKVQLLFYVVSRRYEVEL
jgi:hypothetical protein